jgi:NhaA family Na+:H+ antiporter
LLAATILALIIANSALAPLYKSTLATPLSVGIGDIAIDDSLKSWIKNALMAVFFLYVGLEMKVEFTQGALADRKRAILPFLAAAGGMAVPALVYLTIVRNEPALARGWAIPSATDIAFAVGVVGLIGRHAPASLKAFLLAVAVIDDLGAILIIALFFTGGIAPGPLIAVAAAIVALTALNHSGTGRLWAYGFVGIVLWIALYHSGINPTLAGVTTALFVPLSAKEGGESPVHRLTGLLKNAVVFGIMPIFAFANAGVSVHGMGLSDITSPLTLAVVLGLLVGKPIGIASAVFAARAAGIADVPEGATARQIVGIGALAGIGFTMSLFIGYLAFGEGPQMDQVRLGVLAGSLLATLLGVALLVQRK